MIGEISRVSPPSTSSRTLASPVIHAPPEPSASIHGAPLPALAGTPFSQSPAELLPLVEPYWREAGFEFDREADAAWLDPLAELLRTALTRLDEAADTAALFFKDAVEYDEKARKQLANEGADQVLEGILAGLPETLDSDGAMALIKQVTKDKGVKKGLVMRSLRAGLMGTMQGPEMVPSWLILHQRGVAKARLEAALAIAQG